MEELRVCESAMNEADAYNSLAIAVDKLLSASEDQFETIKKEKWYNRVFDMITFSKKNEKRLAEQVGTLAQAQQIFLELIYRLSEKDKSVSELVLKNAEMIRKLSEHDNYLLELFNKAENRRLGYSTNRNVKQLNKKEQMILFACLEDITKIDNESSEEQTLYKEGLFEYLGEPDGKIENYQDALEDVSTTDRENILSCCLDYIFLRECTREYLENSIKNEYEDIIDSINIGKKTIREIVDQIVDLYQFRKIAGFLAKYKTDSFAELEDSFFIDLELDDVVVEDSLPDIEIKELESETIVSNLVIPEDEIKVFRHKIMHFQAFTTCDGTLIFDQCIIYYNEDDKSDEITINKGGKIQISNSVIICKGYDEKFFIKCCSENEIIIEKTTFLDCSKFIYADISNRFVIADCNLKNCISHFVYLSDYRGEVDISRNIIVQSDLASFNANIKNPQNLFFVEWGKNEAQITNNKVIEKSSEGAPSWESVFYAQNAVISHCSFCGITSPISAKEIKACSFDECRNAVRTGICYDGDKIEDCVFNRCTDVICARDRTDIQFCVFNSCYNLIIEADYCSDSIVVDGCSFTNIKEIDSEKNKNRFPKPIACLYFHSNKSSSHRITKCIFDGVEMNEYFLIASKDSYDGKPNGVVTRIENCDFRNCTTKRASGKIIKEYIKYDSLLKKNQDYHANTIVDCRGLDKVNSGSGHTDVIPNKDFANDGLAIGCLSDLGPVGAPDFIIKTVLQ